MNTQSETTLTEMLEAIGNYPYLRQSFSKYLQWLFKECDENRRKYDAVYFKIKTGANTLGDLEDVFQEFGKILALNEFEFSKIFGFDNKDARHRTDIMKSADLLAEPWVAFAMQRIGFHDIRKVVPRGKGYKKENFSDFTANWNSTKVAIEVKHAREDEDFYKKQMDAIYEERILFLSELRPGGKDLFQQENEILPSRLERRIFTEEGRKKIIEQLRNTSETENCSATMLVISLELSGLMEKSWVVNYLKNTQAKYPVSDYFACCVHDELICVPELP